MNNPRPPRIALFAGSFDPFTIGHQSIVDRGLEIFDRIVIGIGVNAGKKGWLPVEERKNSIERIYTGNNRVKVIEFDCLTTEAARREEARFLLRGVRSAADFEYERTLADINRNLSGIETVLIYALPCYASVSSSVVRELASYGADIRPYLPVPPPHKEE
ncbi:MAG: pantetheine-phosphate adenylyltransferase [Bacteroidales bacterium]|nr:pantetheine-phosphate adenylyltransferase [Bacteroidales bacterium]